MVHDVRLMTGAELLQANSDLRSKMQQCRVTLAYDSVLDALFVLLGGTRPAFNEPVADNVMLRIDPTTFEVVAVEIMDFASDFLPNNHFFRETFEEFGIAPGTADVDRELSGQDRLLFAAMIEGFLLFVARRDPSDHSRNNL